MSAEPTRNRCTGRSLPWVAFVLCLTLLAGAALPLHAQQQEEPPPIRKTKDGLIAMNFKNVDLANFLTLMSETLDVALVYNEGDIRGSVTLISPRTFTREDALNIFETVLNLHGYTTVATPGSPVLQVVPSQNAPRLPSRTQADGDDSANFFVTQIVPLRFADANQIKAAITPLISKTASLAVYAPANVLVISDIESNVKRLVDIIREMDVQPGDVEYEIVRLQYATSAKMAPILTALAQAIPQTGGAPARPPQRGRPTGNPEIKVVAEDRTNTIILVGDPLSLKMFKDIIQALDLPGEVEESGVRVFRLKHADAEEMVQVLQQVDIRPVEQAGAQTAQQQQQARRQQAQQGAVAGALGELTITADKPTNSLIVFGPTEMIDTVGKMVDELDVRRPQVYVEVLIMEMSLEKSLQLGVRWQATDEVGNGVVGAGVPSATPRDLEGALSAGQGSVIGVVGDEITFAGENFVSFSGFIQATQQDQDINVLANPQILTLNNQEAEINVSQVVPVSTRTVTNNQLQTTTEFEFKDIGIILKITPQITGQDKVRLVLNQESSSIAARQAQSTENQQAVTTLKRIINTQVVVDNATTMAIGGLIQDERVETETKVPCLGDIPLLGWLFKSSQEQLRKTNLIVFIRPRIVHGPEDLRSNTERVRSRFDRMRDPKADAEGTLRDSFKLAPVPSPDDEAEASGPPPEQSDSGQAPAVQ